MFTDCYHYYHHFYCYKSSKVDDAEFRSFQVLCLGNDLLNIFNKLNIHTYIHTYIYIYSLNYTIC